MIRFKEFMDDMGLDDKNDIANLYKEFYDEITELISLLDNSSIYADSRQLKKIVHNIKGVSGNLYVDSLNQIAKEYETFIEEALDSSETLDTETHSHFISMLQHSLIIIKQDIYEFFS